MKKTIIVMPVANEETTMGRILDEILALPYDNLYIYPVIDSYSRDRTEEIIREREKISSKVRCIFYRESKGVISCYLEGFRQALKDGAQRIIEMDGGGSHLPSEIPGFIQKLEEGYECVWGSRFIPGGGISDQPLYRRILSSGGTYLANFVLGTRLKDMTSGFEGFQRSVSFHGTYVPDGNAVLLQKFPHRGGADSLYGQLVQPEGQLGDGSPPDSFSAEKA